MFFFVDVIMGIYAVTEQTENWNHLIFLLKFISTAFHARVPLLMAKSV
jgi:hypothetical protein